jgi:hypothetical protein
MVGLRVLNDLTVNKYPAPDIRPGIAGNLDARSGVLTVAADRPAPAPREVPMQRLDPPPPPSSLRQPGTPLLVRDDGVPWAQSATGPRPCAG